MKTNPFLLQRRYLLTLVYAGMSALAAEAQPSAPGPSSPPPTNNTEPANFPLPNSLPGVMTPQRFITEAIWTGMRQERLAAIATRRTMDSKVRTLAQSLGADHSKLNSELRAVARRKGYEAPASDGLQVTNFSRHSDITSIRQDERLLRKVSPDTNTNERAVRDRIGDERGERVRDAEKSPTTGQRTNEFSELAASQALVTNVRLLESAPQGELDRTYLRMVRDEYSKALPIFESASLLTGDVELQQFAAATLAKLRHYENQIAALAIALPPAPSPSNNPELPR